MAPASVLAAVGLVIAVLQGQSSGAEGRPPMSVQSDSVPSPSVPSLSAPSPSVPSLSATPSAPVTSPVPVTPSASTGAGQTVPPAPVADAALRSAAAQADGAVSVSVSVTDLATGQSLAYGASGHAFATASIVKVDILATLLLQAQDRGTGLSDAQQSLAAAMIENSDNDSATALWNAIGQEAGLDAADERFGLTSTVAGTDGYWGLTSTTATDQARLLRQVFTGDSILSSASRDYIRQLLGQVESDQRWGVSAAATGGAYAVKNGWLSREADDLWVINSIGTVECDGHELLIAVLSDGNGSEDAGISLVQSVARAAAGSLNGS
ncbi:serine hydrolase [Streptomyces lactacystinicus]